DDLGGVGKGCPHQNEGQSSCLGRGRIDASCCIDSYLKRACSYIPGVMTGVMCCKPEEIKPRIIVSTQSKVVSVFGRHTMLECHATGKPTPSIKWYKDGKVIVDDSELIKITPDL
ncbi:titin-like, partial [Saccoglossus kowalevskii]